MQNYEVWRVNVIVHVVVEGEGGERRSPNIFLVERHFKAKMHQIRFRLGLHPDPAGGAGSLQLRAYLHRPTSHSWSISIFISSGIQCVKCDILFCSYGVFRASLKTKTTFLDSRFQHTIIIYVMSRCFPKNFSRCSSHFRHCTLA